MGQAGSGATGPESSRNGSKSWARRLDVFHGVCHDGREHLRDRAIPTAAPAHRAGLPAPVYGYSVEMALGSTVLPVFMTSDVLRRIGANHVAIMCAVKPVTTILFGCLELEENMTFLQIAGAGLVLVGVMLVPEGGTGNDKGLSFECRPRNA